MIVLGFDTATAATVVALRLDEETTTEARDDPGPGEHPGHATRLLAMTRELLDEAGVGWSDLDRIAAGVGPGTFTGLRVGIATARGLAQSLSAELVGVSSLAALAEAAFAAMADDPRVDGVLAVIDARRGEAFAAAYERGAGSPVELTTPLALAPEDLGSVIVRAAGASGGRLRRWLAVGDGATRFRGQLEATGAHVLSDRSPLQTVSAAAICELGSRAEPGGGYEAIVPDYRRRPDAEIAFTGAGRGSES